MSNTNKPKRRALAERVQEIPAPRVQETTREDIPALGSFVRVAAWTGIVRDIFTSAVSGRVILQIYFAKNVYKQQKPETHYLDEIANILTPSSLEKFQQEIQRYEEMKDKELHELLQAYGADEIASGFESHLTNDSTCI